MSDRANNTITWVVLIAIFAVSGLATAFWPQSTDRGTMAEAPASSFIGDSAPVDITIPATQESEDSMLGFVISSDVMEISPIVLLLVLTGMVAVPMIGLGAVLSFAFPAVDKMVTTTKEDETFKQASSELENLQSEQLQSMRTDRDPKPMPSHKMPRWTMLSNWLIFAMFSIFTGYIVGESVGNPMLLSDSISTVALTSIILILCATGYVLFQFRPQQLEEFDKEGSVRSIPWDFIAVLFTGLIVVGLGIAYMVFLNTAPPA